MRNLLSSVRTTNKKSMYALAFVLATGISSPLMAGSTPKAVTTLASNISVKYIGQSNYMPVFQVNIDNATQEAVLVTLKDDESNVIYSDKFKGKTFSKNFQFDVANPDNTTITLMLSSKGFSKTESFQISNVSKIVEKISVTKL